MWNRAAAGITMTSVTTSRRSSRPATGPAPTGSPARSVEAPAGAGLLNWVEIDAAAIRHNLAAFRARVPAGTALGAVVKSNGYGHGMGEVAALAAGAGADWLCVNNVDEGVVLRKLGHRQPVLVMGYIALDALEPVVRYGLHPVVYNVETLRRLDELAVRAGGTVPVHVKVETGTHRQGVPEDEVLGFAATIRDARGLELEGVCTHFADIEDTTDHSYAESQIERFTRITAALADAGTPARVRHAACSAAALLFTRTHLDLARIGISLYGLWPSKETYVSCLDRGQPALELRPALAWKTRIAQLRDVPEGSFVGYGRTYRTMRPSRIAVLPVGYHEGYDRSLSGVAHVLVAGRRARICGRVCMNMCMIDVTDIPGVGLEDEVVLLGGQGDECISAEQMAAWCGTISYEVISRIHPALPRVVVNEDDPPRGAS
jgi:alanine racemase